MLEFEILEYIALHKDGILDKMQELKSEARVNPILNSHLKEAEVEWVRQYLAKEMNLSYIEVAEVVDMEVLDKWLTI